MLPTDLRIINELQYSFPVCAEPYKEAAQALDITEDALIARIDELLEEKYLTRFGPMYHAEHMGGALTLAAMAIPESDFDRVNDIVNAMPEIAHNYQRTHEFNMWFVVATEKPEQLTEAIKQIEESTGYTVFNMPKQQEFYVGFYLDLIPGEQALNAKAQLDKHTQAPIPETGSQALTDRDRELIILTQTGLPRVSKPYHQVAQQLDISADEVMSRLNNMLASGVIRRIAAVPNHYKLGYKHNGMTVWDVPDEKINELGNLVGSLPFVSHCYQRPRYLPTWRYNLFAMVHGKSNDEVNEQIEIIKTTLGDDCRANDVLFSTKILKKTGLRIKDKSA